MRLQLIIILFLALGMSVFLYTRPKVVVKDEQGATRDQATQQSETKASGENESHSPELSEEQRVVLRNLKKELSGTSGVAQISTFEKIAELFIEGDVIDSAGYYYEKVAGILPSESNWLRTGDTYFQAYNLALQSKNVSKFAEEAQQAYKNVLVQSPNNLHAMTNLGMTYVTSASPMEAIGMLRQVLELNPNYEPALMNMGVLSLQSNQHDKAASRFRQVLRVNPGNHNAQLGLAYSLIELNQKDEAQTLLTDLRSQNIEPTLKQEVERALQNLK
jgi:predicted Zn-dependent protease